MTENAFSCTIIRVPPPQSEGQSITTAERPIQPEVEEKQFRMGSARNSRCQVRAVGDEGRMARKLSKNLVKARALVEPRPYLLVDAVPLQIGRAHV